jgi:protein-S-isoprenylcysteine O-methyltransferase Ste14
MWLKHLRAILLLPTVVTILVPWWLIASPNANRLKLTPGGRTLTIMLGVLLIAIGLSMLVWTVRLLATQGRGTLAPWDPTTQLVARGPYRHVRNPMMFGVFSILLGEALAFGVVGVFMWFATFVAINVVYIPLLEEPLMERRFGESYRRYKANVPRWIPRLRPWRDPDANGNFGG